MPTEEKKLISKDDLHEFYTELLPYLGGTGGESTLDYRELIYKPEVNGVTLTGNKTSSDLNVQEPFQFETMPTASADYVDKIVQFLGTTTQTYKNGYFYKCIQSGASYSWQACSVQDEPATTGGHVIVNDEGISFTQRAKLKFNTGLSISDDSTHDQTIVSVEDVGGGHTIQNASGTTLTQRDVLQFGTGLNANDDSTNEKTVITPDVMQSGDMDDVLTPLPSVQPNLPVLYDDSETERVVGDALVNGVKKKVYEREHIETIVALPNTWVETTMPVGDIDRVLSITAFSNKNSLNCFICSCAVSTKINVNCFRNVNGGSTEINGFTIRYLKTTD